MIQKKKLKGTQRRKIKGVEGALKMKVRGNARKADFRYLVDGVALGAASLEELLTVVHITGDASLVHTSGGSERHLRFGLIKAVDVDCNQHNKRSEAHARPSAHTQLRRSAGARQFPGTE